MAYIKYGQSTIGGTQVADLMAKLPHDGDELRDLAGWISGIDALGATALESNTDFSVEAGSASAFRDTFLQINADYITFMATNREKIERLARGE